MDLSTLLETIRSWPPALTYAALFGGALAEYVFPPLPGDTVVVVGAVLVGAFGWSVPAVFVVVTAGAVLGAALDFGVGRWLERTGRVERLAPWKRDAIYGLVARFERHGAVYLAVNRFLPGVRAFFFLAAGLAGLGWGPVLLWSTVSAMAWNAVLVGLGYGLGTHLDTLERALSTYQGFMWGLMALVAAWLTARGLRARRARREREARDARGADNP